MALPTQEEVEKIVCGQCRRPVERASIGWNPSADTFRVVVECHGEQETMELGRIMKSVAWKFEAGQAFMRPQITRRTDANG